MELKIGKTQSPFCRMSLMDYVTSVTPPSPVLPISRPATMPMPPKAIGSTRGYWVSFTTRMSG